MERKEGEETRREETRSGEKTIPYSPDTGGSSGFHK
jgi:hypothetical protein